MSGMGKMAVIGDPIAHSLSPLLQNAMLQELGLPFAYEACRVAVEELPEWVSRVRGGEYAAFNATMPHKIHLVPMMDRLTEQASYYGAVNSVRSDGGVLTGHNTDGDGFACLLAEYGLRFSGARVTILGAGGSAGAIAKKAVQDGAAAVTVMNRTLERAQRLCMAAPEILRAAPLGAPPADTELLISTLPVGSQLDLSFVETLKDSCAVFDILYAPPKTPLLLKAQDRGLLAVNGLGMLIHQAILSFSFFTGVPVDQAEMAKKLYALVEKP